MIINNNISAVIANKHLLRNENILSASVERLSSGYKINHSYDNPSGMAISNKMRAQIKALDRATDNTSDGISVVQTADGALNEVTNMLQRMRELSVQSANGTNASEDRQAIQEEVSALRDEIDRVSSTTEFNTKKLLNGDLDTKAYADNVSRLYVSDAVDPGTYKLTVTAAKKAQITADTEFTDSTPAVTADQAGTFTINGKAVTLTEGMTGDDALKALRTAAAEGDVTVTKGSDNKIIFTSGVKQDDYDEVLGNAWGSGTKITIDASRTKDASGNVTVDPKAVEALKYFGLYEANLGTDTNTTVKSKLESDTAAELKGTDARVKLNASTSGNTTDATGRFSSSATATVDGRRVTITDADGFEMGFLLDEAASATQGTSAGSDTSPVTTYGGDLSITVTDIGTMKFHVGANKDQTIESGIKSISAKSLYIDQVNASTEDGATRALDLLDDAISTVSSIRSKLGAVQNRLESTKANLDSTSENVTSAVSRIRDTDMATEMVEYTKDNVLQQAGTSVLSQANELPQMALQLLQ